jgi:hypothetical protein
VDKCRKWANKSYAAALEAALESGLLAAAPIDVRRAREIASEGKKEGRWKGRQGQERAGTNNPGAARAGLNQGSLRGPVMGPRLRKTLNTRLEQPN